MRKKARPLLTGLELLLMRAAESKEAGFRQWREARSDGAVDVIVAIDFWSNMCEPAQRILQLLQN